MSTNINKLVALIECLDYRDIEERTITSLIAITYEYRFHNVVFSERFIRDSATFDAYYLDSVKLNEEEGRRIVIAIDKVMKGGEVKEKENTIKQAINKLRKALKL